MSGPQLTLAGAAQWRAWLGEHHGSSAGVWLKLAKKGSGIPSVTHAEALEEALCYGWIDGQRKSFDEEHFLQRFTPRRPRSIWSKVNCQKALELIDQGRMQAAGLREVERAREDGRWEAAYHGQRDATVPADLHAALDANPTARDFFATLSSQNRYAILFRLHTAKRPETRAARLVKFVAMLAEGRTLH